MCVCLFEDNYVRKYEDIETKALIMEKVVKSKKERKRKKNKRGNGNGRKGTTRSPAFKKME